LLPRLKTAEQFAAVLDASRQKLAQPAGVWRSAHFVLHMAPYGALHSAPPPSADGIPAIDKSPSSATIGVICSKRWAKRAVTRNTIKRQIYAVSSELAAQLPRACIVLRLSHGFAKEAFRSATSPALKSAVRAEIQALLGKLATVSQAEVAP
jgi:ribonuclease P protein component